MNTSEPQRRILTTIKNQIIHQNQNKYQQLNNSKILKYYTLYLHKIVFIQTLFRKNRIRKNHILEQRIQKNITLKFQLEQQKQRKQKMVQQIQKTIRGIQENKQNHAIQEIYYELTQKIKHGVRSTLEHSERVAESIAKLKYTANYKFQKKRKQEILREELKALEFEKGCHQQRKIEWIAKLKQLRCKNMNESVKIRQLQRQFEEAEILLEGREHPEITKSNKYNREEGHEQKQENEQKNDDEDEPEQVENERRNEEEEFEVEHILSEQIVRRKDESMGLRTKVNQNIK